MVMEQAMRLSPPPPPRGGLSKSDASAIPHVLLLPDYLGAASAAFDSLSEGEGERSEGEGEGSEGESEGEGSKREGCGHHTHGDRLCLGCGTVHPTVRQMLSKL